MERRQKKKKSQVREPTTKVPQQQQQQQQPSANGRRVECRAMLTQCAVKSSSKSSSSSSFLCHCHCQWHRHGTFPYLALFLSHSALAIFGTQCCCAFLLAMPASSFHHFPSLSFSSFSPLDEPSSSRSRGRQAGPRSSQPASSRCDYVCGGQLLRWTAAGCPGEVFK
jgi:hypothetical protein